MKRFSLKAIFAFAWLLSVCSAGLSECRAVTTFYPVYVLTRAVADGAAGVTVENMASQSVGCLHDYALVPKDLALIEQADILVANGGGMEQFLDRAAAMRPDLLIVDASSGIEMEDSQEEGLLNAHVWLSPELAAVEIRNIAAGLSLADPDQKNTFENNAEALCERLSILDARLRGMLLPCRGQAIITFHEAFNYFAEAYGIRVAGVIAHEPGENPSTREIADTCDLIRASGILAVFAEPQYPAQAAETIARETGVRLYHLNPFVSGDGTFSGYEEALLDNAGVLLEALTP